MVNPKLRLASESKKGADARSRPSAEDPLIDRVKFAAKSYLTNAKELYFDGIPRVFGYHLPLFVLLGLIGWGYREKNFRLSLLVVALMVPPFIVRPALSFWSRYTVPYTPVLAIFAAAGVVLSVQYCRKALAQLKLPFLTEHGNTWFVRTGAFAMVLGLVIFPLLYMSYNSYRATPILEWQRECIRSGKWIRKHVAGEPKIMSLKPETAFYARGTHQSVASGGIEQVVRHARKNDADLLVLEKTKTKNLRKPLIPLLEGKEAAGLELIHSEEAFSVYRVKMPADEHE